MGDVRIPDALDGVVRSKAEPCARSPDIQVTRTEHRHERPSRRVVRHRTHQGLAEGRRSGSARRACASRRWRPPAHVDAPLAARDRVAAGPPPARGRMTGVARIIEPMAGRLVSPIVVGREAELATVLGALDGALAGRTTKLLIAGEAGVGK